MGRSLFYLLVLPINRSKNRDSREKPHKVAGGEETTGSFKNARQRANDLLDLSFRQERGEAKINSDEGDA